MVDVRRFDGFNMVASPAALDGNGNLAGNTQF